MASNKNYNIEKGASFLDALAEKTLEENNNGFDNFEPEAQEWKANLSDEIDYIIPFDCVAKKIQAWILETSLYPQPAIAFAASMSVISCAVGRTMALENIKGNMMSISLAESGEGKDWPFKAAEKILAAVDMGDRVYKKMASGAALTDALNESPAMLLHIDEMGNYLSSINGVGANNFSKEIIGIITECYTSGSDSYTGKKKKDHIPDVVYEPNICVIGLSTEGQVFEGLRSSDVADGSLARYMLVFGKNGLMPKRLPRGMDRDVPQDIIDDLQALIRKCNDGLYLYSKQLEITDEYHEAKYNLVCEMKSKGNALGGDKAMFKPVYNRIAVRAIQMAMLIDQCKDLTVLEWCRHIDLSGAEIFIKKFLHLGSDNDNEKYAKHLQAKIKESGKKGISSKNLIQKTRNIQVHVRKMMLEEMLVTGMIHTKEMKINNSQRVSKIYFWSK